ncbi:MAG TPA: sodium:solute symporter [Verrucomicrobiota bacterium]|nr:sodium:solute symporter [Verrucomicrobiota bacterium]
MSRPGAVRYHSGTVLNSSFTALDYIVVLVYLAAITAFGIFRGGRQTSAQDYCLGREEIPWWIVCFSIVAAETSALTFISIPGLAYLTNLTFLQVAIGYLIGRIVVSYLLLPAYFRGELSTAYAFLEHRFGRKTRSFGAIVFLFTRIAADGVRLFATAIPLKFVLDVNYPTAIVILAAVALAYTYFGGVRGVIWVDAVQMLVYVGGAATALVFLVARSEGGWSGISLAAFEAGKFQVIDWGLGAGFFQKPYTLIAGLVGGALLSMASHGTDQLIVQRLLATRSLAASRKALIGSGIIIIFQFALFLVVGLLLFGHYGAATVADLGLQRADEIFPKYIIEGLPPGVSGFIIAGLLAAALSTLAGSMSSLSSSTLLDLYRPLSGSTMDDARALWLSRRITVGWAVLLVGSAVFFMNTSQTVVELALSIASFTYGGLLGTFLLGVLLRRARQEDALAAFVGGILVMVSVISLKAVAWTWYTLVGVLATLLIGTLLSRLSRPTPPP